MRGLDALPTGPPVLSDDGAVVAEPGLDAVWEVDTGRRILGSGLNPPDGLKSPTSKSGRLETTEDLPKHFLIAKWNEWIVGAAPKLGIFGKAYSIYDMRSGAFVCRCLQSTEPAPGERRAISSAGDLLVEANGDVYDLPPRVRWGALLGIQSVLALPLISYWALRHWLGRRRSS
jgi:hypothetical protein